MRQCNVTSPGEPASIFHCSKLALSRPGPMNPCLLHSVPMSQSWGTRDVTAQRDFLLTRPSADGKTSNFALVSSPSWRLQWLDCASFIILGGEIHLSRMYDYGLLYMASIRSEKRIIIQKSGKKESKVVTWWYSD